MLFNILMTEPAERDLDAITAYLVQTLHTPTAARHLLRQIDRTIEQLTITPEMYGLIWADTVFRKVPLGNYLMIYRIDSDTHTVWILRFFHGSQNYEAYL